ncbi:Cobyric acid synthase [Prochlorococcus sp. MIT 0603]|nr:Cobyric acid synthase [Prochlorococcus sp. MIT 0603]
MLGTSSGAGKSLMVTAICRLLLRQGKTPIPFKGQNMSNNAWVDNNGGEMAYSQAVQAWASGLEPICSMNPILLKPQGDCTSEIIHKGKSVGISSASEYYENWFISGWEVIQKAIKELSNSYKDSFFVVEGAGSPVEINLQHKDLTNLKLAKYLNAKCILVADIERGGVFAQIIGTLALLKPSERSLIKGIIINRFRGDIALFNEGRKWLEKETKIPILGIMPWLNEIFPAEDSMDLIEMKRTKSNTEIEIGVIRLPSISNFSDLEPLEAESTVQIKWIEVGEDIGNPDALIIPGSKQTIKDLKNIYSKGLHKQIKSFAESGGYILGICGGLQILGKTLEDPLGLESTICSKYQGLGLLPINTTFNSNKFLSKRKVVTNWPAKSKVNGFELHHGKSNAIEESTQKAQPIFRDSTLGWISGEKDTLNIAGIYLHGIFDNGEWRRLWLNEIRKRKGLKELPITFTNYTEKRNHVIDLLTDEFEKHVNLNSIFNNEV